MGYIADEIRVSSLLWDSYKVDRPQNAVRKLLSCEKFLTVVEDTYALMSALPAEKWILAGGFVRDCLLDREINDIDVWFEPPSVPFSMASASIVEESEDPILNKLSGFVKVGGEPSEKAPSGGANVTRYEGTWRNNDYDLMPVYNSGPLVSSFPDSISQIGWSSTGALLYTNEFFRTLVDKKIIFSSSCSEARFEKIKQKFPLWEIERRNT